MKGEREKEVMWLSLTPHGQHAVLGAHYFHVSG